MAAGGRKSGQKSATTFRTGHDSKRGRGPKPGAPNAGRPPDEFKRRMAALASSDEALAFLEAAIRGDHGAEIALKARRHAEERGYGKPEQPVTVSGDELRPLTIRVING